MHDPLTDARPARIVIGDGDGMFRASLRQLLEAPASVLAEVYGVVVGPGFHVAGEADCGEDAAALARRAAPDLLLVDLRMPGMAALAPLAPLAADGALPRTVLLSDSVARAELADAIRLGVRGVLLKSAAPDALLTAIVSVLGGRCWLDRRLVSDFVETARPLIQVSGRASGARLTRREREVLGLIVAGYANKDIALATSVTEDSIKHHLTRIYGKLGVANRVELAMLATERGLLDA